MKVNKAYKFKLEPTDQQIEMLKQHAGNARFVWNLFVSLNQQEYETNKKFFFGSDLINELPNIKKEHKFLKVSNAQSLQQVGFHFDKALNDCIEGKCEFPKWKKKSKKRDSFAIPQSFKVEKKYIELPKIGKIKYIKHRPIKGKIKSLTISRDGELWFVSVKVDLKIKDKPIDEFNSVGIDVGIKTYATFSDGEVIANPKFIRKYEKKLKREQRRLDKKIGIKNKEKQRKKLAKAHRKVRNSRKYFQDKVTKDIIAKYDVIFLEALNIKGMMKNHCLAKAVADCAWFAFKQKLKYKALWKSKKVIEIDRFEPTSKTCSCCGWVNKDLKLKDRVFLCKECNLTLDRDLNAAINIRNKGIRLLWGTQEASARKGKSWETRGCRASAQCLSKNKKQNHLSPKST